MSRIIQLSPLDIASGVETNVTTTGFVIDAILDIPKIRDAGTKIAKKWPSLGGWLQRNAETSKIELVVPPHEDSKLEVIVQDKHQSLATLQPPCVPTSGISIQRVAHDLSLYLQPERNLTMDEYIDKSISAFHINITRLTDATIFTLTHPHLLMDAGGLNVFMKAFFSVIRGEDIDAIVEEDPFNLYSNDVQIHSDQDEWTPPGWTLYGPPEFKIYMDSMEKDKENEGEIQLRIIYFPKAEIEKLKKDCLAELRAEGINDVAYFSSGDVILAWIYKHLYGWPEFDHDRLTRAVNLVDTRLRLDDVLSPNKPYLRNAFLVMATEPLTRQQVHELSIAHLARKIRNMVTEQTTREFMENHLRWKLRHRDQVQVGWGPHERIAAASNWLPFNFGDLDFSIAALPNSGTGKVRDVFLYSGRVGVPRGGGNLVFKDAEGGVVGTYHFGSKAWNSGELRKYLYPSAD